MTCQSCLSAHIITQINNTNVIVIVTLKKVLKPDMDSAPKEIHILQSIKYR